MKNTVAASYPSAGSLFSRLRSLQAFATLAIALLSATAQAESAPDCLGMNGESLAVDNAQALTLKRTGKSGVAYRARVQGKVVSDSQQRCSSRSGTCHAHFDIQIGPKATDLIEVVYSEDFGKMKEPQIGDTVEACGDFLNTSQQRNSGKSGAIIHWVHRSNCMDHEHGYVLIEGRDLFGMDADRNPRPCRAGVDAR